MSSFEQAAERHRQAASYNDYRGGDYGDPLFVEVAEKALPKDKTFRSKLMPPVAGKFDEVPLVYARHRLEVVRSPQIAKPKDPKVAERLNYQVVNEWALSHLSYPGDHEDIPQVLRVLLEASTKIGFLIDKKGFQHKNEAVRQAAHGLLPWTQNLIPVLMQGTKRKIGERISGDRTYPEYTIDPHNDPNYENWQPVILNIENKNLMNFFFERGGQFLGGMPLGPQGQKPSLWGRKGGPFMLIKTARTYDMTFVGNRLGEISQELWKKLIDGMPDYAKRMVNVRKTDDEILDLIERSWYWEFVTEAYPQLKTLFTPVGGSGQDWSVGSDALPEGLPEAEVQPVEQIYEDGNGGLCDVNGNPVDEYGYPLPAVAEAEAYEGPYYDDEGQVQEASYEA